jgi:type IV pilus assembly protein PilF
VGALPNNHDRDALEYLQRALRIDPNYRPALLNLAQVKYRLGNFDEARSLIGRYNKLVEPTAQSLWLALRIERKLGDYTAATTYANQLRRQFAGSKEYQDMQKGQFQ